MSKSIRIRTKPNDGDNYVKINLTQSFDFLEILSLKLRQEELYRIFAADYGVIVGRVIANRGFGVPNAKVSVFIPLDENENDPEIIGRYPYSQVSDTDSNGVRYNLLEDTQQGNCHTPVGTFPNKRKVLDNDVWLEIYDKYYKFTTTTNQAGDFMIFGVPTGNQKVHMDVDVSDIGFVSVKPYELINQGYTQELFESNTTFKGGTDLNSLVQIQSRDFNVNVLPFWGDVEQNEVGINRVDFNLGVDITPTSIFFGSTFTDQKNRGVYKGCTPRILNGSNCELSTGTGKVEIIRRISNDSNEVEFISGKTTKIDENGNWSIIVPMNLDTVVTDEFGNLIPSEDPNVGIPTKAKVRFRISLDEFRFGFRKRTGHYLVPNMYNRFQFGSDTDDSDFYEMRWKKVYTVTNYIPRYQKSDIFQDETLYFTGIKFIGDCENIASFPFNRIDTNFNPLYNILCLIITFVAAVLSVVNLILRVIIFDVVLKFVCLLKHPFNAEKRSQCRCRACLDLNSGVENGDPDNLSPPSDWGVGTYPDDNSNLIDDRLECAVCYDGGDSDDDPAYSIKTDVDALLPSITTPLGGTGTLGVYSISNPTTSGDGEDVDLSISVNVSGDVVSITATDGGNGYRAGDTITISAGSLGGGSSALVITLVTNDLQTTVTVGGDTIDCDSLNTEICKGLCQQCDISIIPLECNGEDYNDAFEWAECVTENLAEDLGVIVYEFYNDWVIGSLYSFLFDYKVRFKRRGTNLEKFCDFDCRILGDSEDPDNPRRKNICRGANIVDKEQFNGGTVGDYLREEINSPDGLGLIVQNNNFLYYASRHDIDINTTGDTEISVEDKSHLLFATNIIELGSSLTCDIDREPFLVDRLVSTSYKKDDGTGTLFNVSNCFLPEPQDINYDGIQLMSQVGVDILIAETERISNSPILFDGEDDETYEVYSDETNLPDYDGQNSVLILDRDDIILRQHLCENFNFYSTSGVYSTTSYPLSTTLAGTVSTSSTGAVNTVTGVGTSFLTDFSVTPRTFIKLADGQVGRVISITNNTTMEVLAPFSPDVTDVSYGVVDGTSNDVIIDEEGNAVTSLTDICEGFDDLRDNGGVPADNMPPYYMYFGINIGKTALDKMKDNYFDNCVE